jgi:hypothetical protein
MPTSLDQDALLVEIDAVLAALAGSLTQADRDGGWSLDSQAAMRGYYERMRGDLVAGADLAAEPAYETVIRGLDSWGVSSGPLCDRCLDISATIRHSRSGTAV